MSKLEKNKALWHCSYKNKDPLHVTRRKCSHAILWRYRTPSARFLAPTFLQIQHSKPSKSPDRLWNPPSLLFNGHGFFSWGKLAGAWSLPFTTIYCRGWEWTELYLPLYAFTVGQGQLYSTLPYRTETNVNSTVHTT